MVRILNFLLCSSMGGLVAALCVAFFVTVQFTRELAQSISAQYQYDLHNNIMNVTKYETSIPSSSYNFLSKIYHEEEDPDHNCLFRNSSLYRKVFVYPTYGEPENGWQGDILSDFGKNWKTINNDTKSLIAAKPWPWLAIDEKTRKDGSAHYHPHSQVAQFATELIVRDIFTHPDSCLRTYDPEAADLFYVPYLPSVEFHAGVRGRPPSFATSVYAQAISDAIDHGVRDNYTGWEQHFGLTSKYWRRRKGADHILVFSEPLQGLSHPKQKRGNYHFVHTQRQLAPPIVISVELSTTFVDMYPRCAAKNILVPYPVTDGRYYNGELWKEVWGILEKEAAIEGENGNGHDMLLPQKGRNEAPIISPKDDESTRGWQNMIDGHHSYSHSLKNYTKRRLPNGTRLASTALVPRCDCP